MAGRAPPKRKTPLDPLLEAVLDDPADDAKRLVYADALSERGDPRGEFIVAQMHGGDAVANEEWLGPIAKIVDPERTVFRRGFVQGVFVKKGPRPAIEKTAGTLEWGTIERVAFEKEVGGVVIKNGAVKTGRDVPAARLLLSPAMKALREIAGIDADVLTTLARHGTALPLVSIEGYCAYRGLESVEALPAERTVTGSHHGGRGSQIFAVRDETLAALSERALFPKLRRLRLESYPSQVPDVLWLVRTALVSRLEELTLQNWGGTLAQWAGIAQGAAKGLVRLTYRPDSYDFEGESLQKHRWRHCFTRGPDGLLSALDSSIDTDVEPGPHDPVREFTEQLESLDGGLLTSLKVSVSRRLYEDEQKTIRALAARAGIPSVEFPSASS